MNHFGLGLLTTAIFSKLFNIEITWTFLLLNIAINMLPDIDIFVEMYQRKGKIGGKVLGFHRETTHYPIIHVIVSIIIFAVVDVKWATIYLTGTMLHMFFDTIGGGWGIKWFWPLSKANYKVFTNKDATFSSKSIAKWEPDELKETVLKYGVEDWIREFYFKPSKLLAFDLLQIFVGVITLATVLALN